MQPHFITLHPNAKDITGQQFGRLTVIGPVRRTIHRQISWLCHCQCGNSHIANGTELRSNSIKSCGCLLVTRGATDSPLGHVWYGILRRCHNPNDKDYPNYGGRGITVCDAWRDNFAEFEAYASQLPHYGEKNYSLDRIDNSLGYFPGNIRWATPTQQSRNKRDNKLITFDGQTKCIGEWAKILGIKTITLRTRLDRLGWSPEKALTQKVRAKKR